MLEYFGQVTELKEEIACHISELERVYRDLFGQSVYVELSNMSKMLLTPSAYQSEITRRSEKHDYDFHKQKEEADTYCLIAVRERNSSRFSIPLSGKINHISNSEMNTAPIILITKDGLENVIKEKPSPKNAPRYLTVYLHEYNHFITYCLQRRPLIAACFLILNEFVKMGLDTKLTSLENQFQIVKVSNDPDSIRYRNLFSLYTRLHLLSENIADYFTLKVLTNLGYTVEKGSPYREWIADEEELKKIQRIITGDVTGFVRYIKNWHQRFPYKNLFERSFCQSIESLRIKRHSIEHLEAL